MWPVTLPAKAFRLRVERRTCRRGRCKLRALRSRRAAKASGGRVRLVFRLTPGRYRLTPALSAKGHDARRGRPRSVLVRR
jgi:hypothetical protein